MRPFKQMFKHYSSCEQIFPVDTCFLSMCPFLIFILFYSWVSSVTPIKKFCFWQQFHVKQKVTNRSNKLLLLHPFPQRFVEVSGRADSNVLHLQTRCVRHTYLLPEMEEAKKPPHESKCRQGHYGCLDPLCMQIVAGLTKSNGCGVPLLFYGQISVSYNSAII